MTHRTYKPLYAGFTLIEALVAIAIVTIAMGGPFWVAGQASIAAHDAKNRLVASYLAQEGIEYIRLMRDNTYLANQVTDVFYDDFLGGGVPTSINGCIGAYSTTRPGGDGSIACALDASLPVGVGSALQVCGDLGCSDKPLHYDSATGRYVLAGTISGSTPSIFSRSIRVYHYDSDYAAGSYEAKLRVDVEVKWNFRGLVSAPRSVKLTTYLSSWQ